MIHQLPALQVLIPLLAAPLCVVLHRGRWAWFIACLASASSLVISLLLMQLTADGTVLSYRMGNWAPPWGIEYRVDILSAFVLLIVSGISTVVLPYSLRSAEKEVHKNKLYLLYAGWLIVLTGLLGMTITGDAFNVFVFLEISSLATYLIIALSRDRRSLTAAFQYLLLGTVGASFILLSIGLLYQVTGTLNMADMAQRLPAVSQSNSVKIAFVFLLLGLGTKAAIFPLHSWLAGAYRFAPSPVTAFLAGSATKVSVYVLLRFIYTVYGQELAFKDLRLDQILLPLALLSIVIPSMVAINQQNFKRLLAFSSISQIGYMVLGIAINNHAGLSATVLHLFNHAIMKAALFMSMGAVFYQVSGHRIVNLSGLGRHMPLTFAGFILAGLSLIGIPMTAGFISKWYLVMGALSNGWWPIALMVLLSSLLAVVYIWKVIEAAYFKKPVYVNAGEAVEDPPLSMLLPLYILIAANIWFGLDTSWTVGTASSAADILLSGSF